MSKILKKLRNVHVSASNENGTLTFLHKVKNGSIDKSYGINVASLANLPEEVIARANEILETYEKRKDKKENYMQTSFDFKENTEELENDKLLDKIKSINPLEMTPMQALNYLYELKEEFK